MRSEEEVNKAIEQYSDTIRRICIVHLKNYADTEDIFQTVFLKYVLSSVSFETQEHEKAWFIRVTINACKDLLKTAFRRYTVSIHDIAEQVSSLSAETSLQQEHLDVLQAILALPVKYRDIIYLYYYEGYTVPQISLIIKKKVNTVYTLLARAKTMLKEKLGGVFYEI